MDSIFFKRSAVNGPDAALPRLLGVGGADEITEASDAGGSGKNHGHDGPPGNVAHEVFEKRPLTVNIVEPPSQLAAQVSHTKTPDHKSSTLNLFENLAHLARADNFWLYHRESHIISHIRFLVEVVKHPDSRYTPANVAINVYYSNIAPLYMPHEVEFTYLALLENVARRERELHPVMQDIKNVLDKLYKPSRVVLTTHTHPDADALGSSLALWHLLHQMGHEVHCLVPSKYPLFLGFLPGIDKVIVYSSSTREEMCSLIGDAALLFSIDYCSLARITHLSPAFRKAKGVKVLIDHHLHRDEGYEFGLHDPDATSTAELLVDFIDCLDERWGLTEDIATCLYAGILTDTAKFAIPGVGAETHRKVARLIDSGANAHVINRVIYGNYSLEKLQLVGHILLNRLKVLGQYGVALLTVDREDHKLFNIKPGDTEGLVNFALGIEGVVMGVILIEKERQVQISFRSHDNYNVNRFAQDHFNGGGHKNASGGRSSTSLRETLKKVISLAKDFKTGYCE